MTSQRLCWCYQKSRISLLWEMNSFETQNCPALSEYKHGHHENAKKITETPFYSPGWTDTPGSNPVRSWIFVFKPYFCNCINCLHNYNDLLFISALFFVKAHGWRIDALTLCTFLLLLLNACVSLCCHSIDFEILKNICVVRAVNGKESRDNFHIAKITIYINLTAESGNIFNTIKIHNL